MEIEELKNVFEDIHGMPISDIEAQLGRLDDGEFNQFVDDISLIHELVSAMGKRE